MNSHAIGHKRAGIAQNVGRHGKLIKSFAFHESQTVVVFKQKLAVSFLDHQLFDAVFGSETFVGFGSLFNRLQLDLHKGAALARFDVHGFDDGPGFALVLDSPANSDCSC